LDFFSIFAVDTWKSHARGHQSTDTRSHIDDVRPTLIFIFLFSTNYDSARIYSLVKAMDWKHANPEEARL
jgi:hypothetical protein